MRKRSKWCPSLKWWAGAIDKLRLVMVEVKVIGSGGIVELRTKNGADLCVYIVSDYRVSLVEGRKEKN